MDKRVIVSLVFTPNFTKQAADLDEHVARTMDDLETYADHTAASLISLSVEALGVKDVNADHAASHIGERITLPFSIKWAKY